MSRPILTRVLSLFLPLAWLAAPAQMPEVQPRAGATPARVTFGPSARAVSPTTALIYWSSNVSTSTELRYGTDPAHLDRTAKDPFGGMTHHVLLQDLIPGTLYFYRVVIDTALTGNQEPMAAAATFRTEQAGSKPSD
jgi:phosphodiesterase/alkaline phosphatase D-like protein